LASVLKLVLRVIGLSLVVVNIILFLTPTSVFPGFRIGSPPVEIVSEHSGLRCYEVYVVNKSSQEQNIVVLVKSSLDYSPCRSSPTTLGPNESTVVTISPSVQPSMGTNPQGAADALAKWDYVGVEYAQGALPSGSAQAFGAHAILQVISGAIGVGLLVAAQKVDRHPKETVEEDVFRKELDEWKAKQRARGGERKILTLATAGSME
jgi:hypothetical protein